LQNQIRDLQEQNKKYKEEIQKHVTNNSQQKEKTIESTNTKEIIREISDPKDKETILKLQLEIDN
jgi:hypothetical protein